MHQFLVGTVLYITAIGLYQLFVADIKMPGWLQIDSPDELEGSLISVTQVDVPQGNNSSVARPN